MAATSQGGGVDVSGAVYFWAGILKPFIKLSVPEWARDVAKEVCSRNDKKT